MKKNSDLISLFAVNMPHSVDQPLLKVLHSGYIGQGPVTEEFERKFGEYVGNLKAVSVNAGTSALQLALRLANVGPGDYVITTAMTCTATNLPILAAGAIPLFADIDPDTGMLDPDEVLQVYNDAPEYIRKKIKAVMVVDWGGSPAKLEQLKTIANYHDMLLIEDAAHAFGAKVGEKPIGSIADITCYSFQAIKTITTVDGGMLTMLDPDHYKRAKILRWFGIDRDAPSTDTRIDQDIFEWGYKYHMNDVTATIGLHQLDYVDNIIAKQRDNAAAYNKAFAGLSNIAIPKVADHEYSTYWLYTLQIFNKQMREQFKTFMAERNIMVSQVHKRNDHYTVFKPYAPGDKTQLDNLTRFADRMICIPVHAQLTTFERDKIIAAVKDFVKTI